MGLMAGVTGRQEMLTPSNPTVGTSRVAVEFVLLKKVLRLMFCMVTKPEELKVKFIGFTKLV
jgi:hypothetical protein